MKAKITLNKTKLQLTYTLIFFILSLSAIVIFELEKRSKINEYLRYANNDMSTEYNTIYNSYKVLSNLIFETNIDTKEVKDIFKEAYNSDEKTKGQIREKLYKKLIGNYNTFKTYNLKQLHFHLPDNESFLRMHRPNKYGDNLTNIRESVAYVNKNKKKIEGFEEGKIFNGFRFVYPLFHNDIHIGSVEVSFSAYALIKDIIKNTKTVSNMIIKKSTSDKKLFQNELENYQTSHFKNFYYEKQLINKLQQTHKINFDKEYISIKNSADAHLNNKNAITVYDESTTNIFTFMPLKNPVTKKVVAYIIMNEKSQDIKTKYTHFYILSILNVILFAIVNLFLYREATNKHRLQKLTLSLGKKIKEGIQKNREKDRQLFQKEKLLQMSELMKNISHHWRQPLSIISTVASGMKLQQEYNMLDEETIGNSVEQIIQNTDKLNNTLEFFIQGSEIKSDNTYISLSSIIESSIKILQESFKFSGIKINKQYEDKDLEILTNQSSLRQVIISIMTNAKEILAKRNIKDKTINILTKQDDGYIYICIEDNAGGVDSKIIDHIFEPYFTTKHEIHGVGLSLYISYDIVTKDLGGDLFVENSQIGAKFIIKLPKEIA